MNPGKKNKAGAVLYKKWLWWITVLSGLVILTSFLAISCGSAKILNKDIFIILANYLQGQEIVSPEATIILNLRIPRLILGLMVGGALALVGVIFQGMFRNPLVEPYTLGVSGGAALGIAIASAFGLRLIFGLPLIGFLGALLAIFIVYAIACRWKSLKMTSLLLVGVMFSFISSSLIMLILSLSCAEEAHGILFWIMGSLEENEPILLKIVCIVIPIMAIFSFFKAWQLNALALGEEEAGHLGIDIKKTKRSFFYLSSILAGVAVSVSGIIGFVGLIVPHFMRRLVGSDHRILMPTSFLLGGIFLVLSDTFARTVIAPIELPVGVITGIVGGIIFIGFLVSGESRKWPGQS